MEHRSSIGGQALTDDIEKNLRALKESMPKARLHASIEERIALIHAIGGPRTAESIRKAMKTSPPERLPFLFSSLDSQLVLDVMANDLDELIQKLKTKKTPS